MRSHGSQQPATWQSRWSRILSPHPRTVRPRRWRSTVGGLRGDQGVVGVAAAAALQCERGREQGIEAHAATGSGVLLKSL